jgi:hypothetical protein
MPYRADVDALEARAAVLERELAALRDRTREAAALKQTERDLENALTETRRLLAASASSRVASRLDDVKIATPCHARWDDMIGDDKVRFCGKCQKDVYNLSAMAREDAETLLRERSGSMCARLYRRTDGTVMTADCPVGVRAKRVRRLAIVVGGGLAAGLAAGFAATRTMGDIRPPQGQIAEMGAPPPHWDGPVEPPTAAPIGSTTVHAMMGAVSATPTHEGKGQASHPQPPHR